MKKIVIILSLFALIASGCGHATKKQTTNENSSVCQQDTLIKLSETHGILFLRYDKEMELWYEPRIVDFRNNDSVKIENLSYENGSELYVNVSPNKKYAVIDNIVKGYVEDIEEKILHEIYFCVIIDIENAKVVETMQSDCSGEWDKNSNWVNNEEIIFSADTEENNTTENTYLGYEFGDGGTWDKIIYDKENLTTNDSIYMSNIRPNEKLTVGKTYTNSFEFLDYNDEGDDFTITVIKDNKIYTFVANGFWDTISQFKKGSSLEIQWKIDFLTPAGDDTIFFVVKAIEKITKINPQCKPH